MIYREPTLAPHRDAAPCDTGRWHGGEWGEFTTIGGYRYRSGEPCILCEDTETLRRFIITVERWTHERARGYIHASPT